jgi:hypothetical protein
LAGFTTEGTYTEDAEDFEDPQNYETWITETKREMDAEIVFPKDDCLEQPSSCYSWYYVSEEPGNSSDESASDSGSPTGTITLDYSKVRYRWVVPSEIVYRQDPDVSTDSSDPPIPDDGYPDPPSDSDLDPDIVSWWKGTYYKIMWDVLTEPDDWDATIKDPNPPDPLPEDWDWAEHQVPKPGRGTRTYVQDLTWEWTGPGDPENDDSWVSDWYFLEPPPVNGNRRIVNIRVTCYRGPFGSKKQLTGEEVDLSQDTPLQNRLTSDRHSIKLPTITI